MLVGLKQKNTRLKAKHEKDKAKAAEDQNYITSLEKENKRHLFENQKAKKKARLATKQAKDAKALFKKTLEVKMQYEEVLCELNANPKISLTLHKVIDKVKNKRGSEKLQRGSQEGEKRKGSRNHGLFSVSPNMRYSASP